MSAISRARPSKALCTRGVRALLIVAIIMASGCDSKRNPAADAAAVDQGVADQSVADSAVDQGNAPDSQQPDAPAPNAAANSFGGAGSDTARDVAVDSAGVLFVVGQFEGGAKFGGVSKSSAGKRDGFALRRDVDGRVAWVVAIGGSDSDNATSVCLDGKGGVLVAGTFRGTMTLGSSTLVGKGSGDAFVARLSVKDGAVDWVAHISTSGAANVRDIVCDASGASYVAGSLSGSGQIGGKVISAFGPSALVAKVSATGAIVWATISKGGGSTSINPTAGRGIALTPSGDLVVAGNLQGGPITFGNTTVGSQGSTDIFVAGVDKAGTYSWVVTTGGKSLDGANAVVVDAAGAIYVAGKFAGTVPFGKTTLTAAGTYWDLFVARVTKAGFEWVIQGKGPNAIEANALALSTDGKTLHVAGGVAGGVDLGGKTTTTGSRADSDVLFARIATADGKVSDIQRAGRVGGSSHVEQANAVALDPLGRAVVAGDFSDWGQFGALKITGRGRSDAFVWTVDP